MMIKMETFFEFLEREPKVDTTSGKETNEQLAGKLVFSNVSFEYPTRPDSDILKVSLQPDILEKLSYKPEN